MIFRRRLGPKGQVVIPKDVRDHLRLREGSNVVFEVGKDDTALMRAETSPTTWLEEYLSVVKEKSTKRIDMKAIIEEEASEEIDLLRQ